MAMNKRLIYIIIILFSVFTVHFSILYAEDHSTILENIEINNFKKYNDNYYRGANPKNSKQYEDLKALGVKTIIDLRNMRDPLEHKLEEKKAEKYGLKYFKIRLRPWTPPKKKEIEEFFKIVDNPEYQPVFVHCTYGEDRTGIMSALYRAENDKWSFEEAYDEMLEMGYHNRLYSRLKKFLKKHYKQKEKLETIIENPLPKS